MGQEIPRYEVLGEITRRFVATVEEFAADHEIPMVEFERGQDKEDFVKPLFESAQQRGCEGVVLIGVSEERARAFQAPRKRDRERGKFKPGRRGVFVKHYYVWSPLAGLLEFE